MPIRTLRCLGCARQWDELLGRDETPKCNKCGTDQVALVPTYPSTPRGTFGTVRRNSRGEAGQEFNFQTQDKKIK